MMPHNNVHCYSRRPEDMASESTKKPPFWTTCTP